MKKINTTPALTPANFKEASQLAAAGKWVDISALTPVSAGKFQRQEASFQEHVQQAFAVLTETGQSEEYAGFLKTVEQELEHIAGLTVVSDLEFVVVFRCDNEMYSDFETNPRYVYLLDPYICRIYEVLQARGNELVFWTSAIRMILDTIRSVLPDSLVKTPAICREDCRQMLDIFLKRANKEITVSTAMKELKSMYAAFSDRAYKYGLKFFSEQKFLSELTSERKTVYAARNKFPILLADPANGVFIDDNIDYINSAESAGWPKKRSIHVDPGYFSLRRAREVIDGLRRIIPPAY